MSDKSRDAVAELVRTVRQLTPEQVKTLREKSAASFEGTYPRRQSAAYNED